MSLQLSKMSEDIVLREMEKITAIYEKIIVQNSDISLSMEQNMAIALAIYVKNVYDMQFIEEYD